MSNELDRLDAVDTAIRTFDAAMLREKDRTERRANALHFVDTLRRQGYGIVEFSPDHPDHPEKQRRRDMGRSTSDRAR
jgi:hypothetical protein